MVFSKKEIYKHFYVSQEINQAPWTKNGGFYINLWRSFFGACEIMQHIIMNMKTNFAQTESRKHCLLLLFQESWQVKCRTCWEIIVLNLLHLLSNISQSSSLKWLCTIQWMERWFKSKNHYILSSLVIMINIDLSNWRQVPQIYIPGDGLKNLCWLIWWKCT